MSQMSQIRLKSSCILGFPFQIYHDDFSFIVNGQEFKTSRIVSDLISPKIRQMHLIDPTFDIYVINTNHHGTFSYLFQLLNFTKVDIPAKEVPFIIDVIEKLGNESIDITELENHVTPTLDNIFSLISKHELFGRLYSKSFESDIDFIASHFHEICDKHEDDFCHLKIDTLSSILNHENLRLKDEDQLLKFVNRLYSEDRRYSVLYESVIFANASSEAISEFAGIFYWNDLTDLMWQRLIERLEFDIKNNIKSNNLRYVHQTKSGEIFEYSSKKQFSGIINHLKNESGGSIENSINITSSSLLSNDNSYSPYNVTLYEDHRKYFATGSAKDSWISFDFKDQKIIPTHYTIQTPVNVNCPRNWVIEVSNDNETWKVIDEQKECSYTKNTRSVHTFCINQDNVEKISYLRMRQTGPNWYLDQKYLMLDSFEVYGTLFDSTQ